MTSRHLLPIVPYLSLVVVLSGGPTSAEGTFRLEETTIADIQGAFEAETLTAEELVQLYLDRIEVYDQQGPKLNAIITINPNALETARALDKEREAQGPRGPLHGIPIFLKDSYDTFDMPTTAGSIALEGSIPPDDASQTRRLREAGAVILGKTNLDEFSCCGAGLSSLGGQTLNPYDTRRIPSGSSAGTGAAIAANFAVVGTGTDWGGSIRSPASANNLVGLRPTLGLTSRDGIVPFNLRRDMGGPMARTVTDAALLLDAIAGYDPADPVTEASRGRIPASYTEALDSDGLRGARIGVARDFTAGAVPRIAVLFEAAVADLAAAGAEMVDPVEMTEFTRLLEAESLRVFSFFHLEYYLNDYLSTLGDAPASLREIIRNRLHHATLTQWPFGFLRGSLAPEDDPEYEAVLATEKALRDGLLEILNRNELDALVFPTRKILPGRLGSDPNARFFEITFTYLAPFVGFPEIALPTGLTPEGVPVGIDLLGRPFSEPTLLKLAYAYEQGTQHRRPPPTTPELDCNGNGITDGLEISRGMTGDCNGNRIPNECETDCNGNGVADDCDIMGVVSLDCDGNGVPDECEPDCNENGLPDPCEILDGISADCNGNLRPDLCEAVLSGEPDENRNDVADSCEPTFIRGDCDGDGEVLITDGLFLLNFLFLGRRAPDCQAACDSFASGFLGTTTAVGIFEYLFLGGPPPSPPFPECGVVAEGVDLDLGCETSTANCR